MDNLTYLDHRIEKIEDTLKELKEILKGQTVKPVQTLPENEREKIDYIIRNFDFGKVHEVMKMLDWKWVNTPSSSSVPTIEEMKEMAERILVEAASEKTTIATGGFRATYDNGGDSEDPDPYIRLEFIVEECEGFADD